LLPEQEGAAMISAGLSIREYGGYVFVNLHGELDVGDAARVADALTAVASRNPRIIVDLAALVFIDCCAVGELSRVRARARHAGGDLLLAAPCGQVRRILTLTAMTGVFPVCASLAEAVRIAGCSRAPCRRPAATVSSARCPGHPRHPHRNQRAGRRHPGRAAALSGSGRARTRPDHAMQLTRKD
jgi:anti-sigma B factor antagonist